MAEIAQLESQPDFWQDANKAAGLQKEKNDLQAQVEAFKQLQDLADEFTLCCSYWDDGDVSVGRDLLAVAARWSAAYQQMERQLLMSEECDGNNAIISINAGAGGTESCDWASMLYRMLTHWMQAHHFKLKFIAAQEGEVAGLKSTTFMAIGKDAYGLLKSESGIHRLVRISPFDANARRHTSFASVYVSPEVDDNIQIEILEKDLKIDVYRSGGSGGQGVNTTDSAVRMTHLPTGIVVTCQNERSQLQNRAQALKILRSRLYEKAQEEKRQAQAKLEAGKKDIAWGSQIRSYVLHPYKLVKDHRTEFESSAAEKVLDGDLDGFIDAYLHWRANPK